MPPLIYVCFDSCGFAPPIQEEKQAVAQLLALGEEHHDQVIIGVPQAVSEETSQAPDRARRIAQAQIYDLDLFTTQGEQQELLEVRILLFGTPTGLSSGKVNDARNLLCAKKYCCTYFVSFDRNHILSKRDEIKSKLGFEVVTPSECLRILRAHLSRGNPRAT